MTSLVGGMLARGHREDLVELLERERFGLRARRPRSAVTRSTPARVIMRTSGTKKRVPKNPTTLYMDARSQLEPRVTRRRLDRARARNSDSLPRRIPASEQMGQRKVFASRKRHPHQPKAPSASARKRSRVSSVSSTRECTDRAARTRCEGSQETRESEGDNELWACGTD